MLPFPPLKHAASQHLLKQLNNAKSESEMPWSGGTTATPPSTTNSNSSNNKNNKPTSIYRIENAVDRLAGKGLKLARKYKRYLTLQNKCTKDFSCASMHPDPAETQVDLICSYHRHSRSISFRAKMVVVAHGKGHAQCVTTASFWRNNDIIMLLHLTECLQPLTVIENDWSSNMFSEQYCLNSQPPES